MLATGTHLGPYEIRGAIGAGGMGEVYRARDTRLDRTVAIKILPVDVAADAAARERLDREARAISQIDHPHICVLHDIGVHDGRTYLVMQFVEGETLAARLNGGPLPVDRARVVACQIAQALDAAHERGIVHRDLKPANVMLTPSGDAKVLDFGIAKVAAASEADGLAPTHQPTMAQATIAGVVLGTAAYMSPEQSRGKSVDKRTDVWAFGCVLYEMLTGRQAFAGETMTDVLAAIVHMPPDWSALPADTPTAMRRLLSRCLEKDARRRLRDIGDAVIELEEVDPGIPAVVPAATPTPRVDRQPRRGVGITLVTLGILVVVAASGALAALLWRGSAGPITEPPVIRLNFIADPVLHYGAPQPSMAFSPDGNQFVYTSGAPDGAGLYIRSLVDGQTRRLEGATGRNAVFSPDGQWVAAPTVGGINRFPLGTGAAARVSPAANVAGIAWTPRDEIVYATPQGLFRVAATGGEPRRVVEQRTLYPDALPDGRHVVITLENPAARTSDDYRIAIVDLDTGQIDTVVEGGTYGRYAASGHVLYLRQGSIMAVPLDTESLDVIGPAVQVVTGVLNNPAVASGNFAMSPSGTLIYAPGDGSEYKRALIALAPTGVKRVLSEDRRDYANPRISPDGTRVAVVVDGVRNALWMLDVRRGVVSPLVLDEDVGDPPSWAPDSRRLAVAATPAFGAPRNLYVVRADDRSPPQRITTSDYLQLPHSWTPDGRTLLFSEVRPETGSDLWSVDLTGSPEPRPLMQTRFNEGAASLSPDGRWLAYESDQSGSFAVYLTEYPALKTTVQVSASSGRLPKWSTDGRRLFYRSANAVMVVDVSARTGLEVSTPRRWGELPPGPNVQYDLMPNDELLVVDSQTVTGGTRELNVVLNFFTELRQKSPAH